MHRAEAIIDAALFWLATASCGGRLEGEPAPNQTGGSAGAAPNQTGGTAGAAPTSSCTNGLRDGTETDVDCGGRACPACGVDLGCVAGTDCASGFCAWDTCADDCRSLCIDEQGKLVGIPLLRFGPGDAATMTCQPLGAITCRCAPAVAGGYCTLVTDADSYCGDGICRFIETPARCPEDCPE